VVIWYIFSRFGILHQEKSGNSASVRHQMNLLHLPEKRLNRVPARVARWHIFKPKIPIWVNFGGSCNGGCMYLHTYILWSLGIFCGPLDILLLFGTFFPFWYVGPRKIWQPWYQRLY
jgi:hypothetical protein